MPRICFPTPALRSAGWLFSVVVAAAPSTAEVTFEWATVGNAGNPADPMNAAAQPGIGGVGYAYRISKTEVTNAQYVEFLNAVDPNAGNSNGLYHADMTNDPRGGIARNAAAPAGNRYSARASMGNKPVNFVSFVDCMRFTNWLHNGQGNGATGNGAYSVVNGQNEGRDPNARFFIPTQNEWYKAAYYDPTPGAGGGDNYWLYPTHSDAIPTMATATPLGDIANPGANVANYGPGATWNGLPGGNLTTVGSAGALSTSFYGTHDQGGNLFEWNETLVEPGMRGIRGGGWGSQHFLLRSTDYGLDEPTFEGVLVGFRVASPIPEPSALVLLSLGGALLQRRR